MERLEEGQEGLFQSGSMSLKVGLNTVNLKVEHIVFSVSYLEKRRMMDIKLLLKMVGMVFIENKGSKIMWVMLVAHTI